jgi:hypothetical protein
MGGALGDAQFPVNVLKKLRRGKAGIEDQGRSVTVSVKLAEEGTQDRRLSRSHRSRQGNETDAIVNAVQEVCECFPMTPAHKEKAGVRGQAERLFPEAMKIEIHHMLPSSRQVFRKFHPMDGRLLASIPAIKRGKTKKAQNISQIYIIFQ